MHNQYFWDLEQARFADKPEPQPGNRALHQEPRSNSKKIARSDIFVGQKLERDKTNMWNNAWWTPQKIKDAFVLVSCLGAKRTFTMHDFSNRLPTSQRNNCNCKVATFTHFLAKTLLTLLCKSDCHPTKSGQFSRSLQRQSPLSSDLTCCLELSCHRKNRFQKDSEIFLVGLVASSVTESVNHSAHLLQSLGVVRGNTMATATNKWKQSRQARFCTVMHVETFVLTIHGRKWPWFPWLHAIKRNICCLCLQPQRLVFVFAIAAIRLFIHATGVLFCAFPLLITLRVGNWKIQGPKQHGNTRPQTTLWSCG